MSSEVLKVEPLEDGAELRYYSDGRILAVDASGRFMQHELNYLPPDLARAKREGHSKRRAGPTLEEVDALLEVLPGELLQDPREEWIIRHLAASLVVGGAGTASVAKELIQRIRLPARGATDTPQPYEVRPLIPESDAVMVINGQQYAKMTQEGMRRLDNVLGKMIREAKARKAGK